MVDSPGAVGLRKRELLAGWRGPWPWAATWESVHERATLSDSFIHALMRKLGHRTILVRGNASEGLTTTDLFDRAAAADAATSIWERSGRGVSDPFTENSARQRLAGGCGQSQTLNDHMPYERSQRPGAGHLQRSP
jgi:hypothetical protein